MKKRGWKTEWADPDSTEIFLIPNGRYAGGIEVCFDFAKSYKISHWLLFYFLKGIEHFVQKDSFLKHLQLYPAIADDWDSLWTRLQGLGWRARRDGEQFFNALKIDSEAISDSDSDPGSKSGTEMNDDTEVDGEIKALWRYCFDFCGMTKSTVQFLYVDDCKHIPGVSLFKSRLSLITYISRYRICIWKRKLSR